MSGMQCDRCYDLFCDVCDYAHWCSARWWRCILHYSLWFMAGDVQAAHIILDVVRHTLCHKIAQCIGALRPLSHPDRCATEEATLDNCFYKTVYRNKMMHSRRGSLGPSTVILMALWYVATWGGLVNTVMVRVKLFPGERKEKRTGQLCRVEGPAVTNECP